ncbi:MAG: DNA polymerase II [Candidatus Nanoarchaeia archaeon]|nr:DNA polymerase II [Candidatus Nanoarchaeia archaeon]
MKGFVLYSTYRIIGDSPYVFLFGRLEKGESFAAVAPFKPYFYIKEADLKRAREVEELEIEKTGLKTFNGDKVVRIFTQKPSDVPEYRQMLESNGIVCYEADIRFAQRFLIDNDIKGCVDIDGEQEYQDNLLVFKNPSFKPASFFPKLKVLSLDIETRQDAGEVYAISLAADSFENTFINTKKKIKNAVCCKSEEEVLEKFIDAVREFDPDIITGWNLIDFDLKVLQDRMREYGMELALGRGNARCKLRIEKDFMKESKADAEGRLIIDAMQLLKGAFIRLEDYRLETAARTFTGEGKLVKFTSKGNEIDEMFVKNPQLLADYNLQDARLVIKIIEKSNALSLAIERSLLTGMQIDRVSASIASLDSLYIREARKRGLVCPSMSYAEKETMVKGAFVMEPKPGIYENVAVLDFKSLYPSIITTFNIDPSSFSEKCAKGMVKSPNGACFKNEDGILPSIIHKLWASREEARKRKDELARYAIKILMNSFYGAMASPNSRFFNMAIANAITSFAREIIQNTAVEIRKRGYEVLYSDTDSCFVVTKAKNREEAEEIGRKLAIQINEFYKSYVKKQFKRDSFLDMQFDKCFLKFLMPKLRKTEVGAKKRYAGLVIKEGKEKIDITGLEFVRGDWTELAKKFQYELLDRLFHDKQLLPFIADFVQKLEKGEFDSRLVYRKTARKNIDEYTKTTPPHIKAARKLPKVESNIIEYVMTEDGPEPMGFVSHKIDYEHYLKKQLKPIADAILCFMGQTFEDAAKGVKQKNLGDF